MTRRIVVEVLLNAVLTVLLAWVVFGALTLADTGDPAATFLDQVPRVLFGLLGIGLGLWTVLLVIGAIAHRRRAVGWRVATHIASLVIALIVNVAALVAITFATGGAEGWWMLLVGIAVAASAVVLIAGIIAVLVVELLILPRIGPDRAPVVA